MAKNRNQNVETTSAPTVNTIPTVEPIAPPIAAPPVITPPTLPASAVRQKNASISDAVFEAVWLAVFAVGGTLDDVIERLNTLPGQLYPQNRGKPQIATKELNFNRSVDGINEKTLAAIKKYGISADEMDSPPLTLGEFISLRNTMREDGRLMPDESPLAFVKHLPKLTSGRRNGPASTAQGISSRAARIAAARASK